MSYYAMRYLLLWEQAERPVFQLLAKSWSPETLRKSMHHFRISRSFRGIGDHATATLVLDAVGAAEELDPASNVQNLAERFRRDFGCFNLSAASKLLWWKHRRPYLIYDSRAVTALNRIGYSFAVRDYAAYASAWHRAYADLEGDIDEATASLVSLQPFLATWHPTVDSVNELVREKWFKERVFDMVLWEHGARA